MSTRKPARVVCLRRLAWGVAIVGLYFTCCPTKQSLYESATLLWPCELGMEARSKGGETFANRQQLFTRVVNPPNPDDGGK